VTTENLAGRVGWSDSLIVVDGMMPLEAAVPLIRSAEGWVVIRRSSVLFYAFRPEELLNDLSTRAALVDPAVKRTPLAHVLDLHEDQQSTSISDRTTVPPIDRSWRPSASAASVDRWVDVGPDGVPRAVGSIAPGGTRRITRGMRPGTAAAPPPASPPEPAGAEPPEEAVDFGVAAAAPSAPTPARPPSRGGLTHATPPQPAAAAPFEDEGTSPVRHPSIEIDQPPAPGRDVVVTVDLLRETVTHTQGGPINVGQLAADWELLDLTVHVQCTALDFPQGSQAVVTITRNAASTPARLNARVRADAAGSQPVMVTFLLGTRFCGSAMRMFDVGAATAAGAPAGRAAAGGATAGGATAGGATPEGVAPPGGVTAAASVGTVVVEPSALPPDLTIHISKIDKHTPARLRWLLVTERFDGLPPRLEEDIELDNDPSAQASALFREFAVLERGKHLQRIDGFGSRLWTMAPEVFRKVYWALWDRHRRSLTIQFISDEPHMPWELMRPAREDDSEIHPPLALKHAVGRWLKRWDGYMRNGLRRGQLCTIAPKYASASRALKRAQIESDALVAAFSARRESGTRAAVLALLETAPPEPLAVLHFAGHGTFAPEAATQSSIKLEDGDLSASEVERPEVRLGRACRTLVFFNACEVGAAGAVFGEVGGWADAFLGRQFGGFIAPLWSVDDEDAGVVAGELLKRILTQGEPIGAALRAVREAHGATSPTFYSYLYYGDVTARIAV
jgi:hypothetical protein